MAIRILALILIVFGAMAQAQSGADADVTGGDASEANLVRVPSGPKAAVYRDPDVPFSRYQRLEFGQITVKFRKTWERSHHEMKPEDIEKIRGDLARSFREELYRELVERGGYPVAEAPDQDTLRIVASILEVDIAAPEAGNVIGQKTYIRTAGSMKLVVEFRDAASGVLVGRIIHFAQAREYEKQQLASQVGNADEFRRGFATAARYTREALNVAKTEKPR
jgi:hypothetical protein